MARVEVKPVEKCYPRRVGWRSGEHAVVSDVSFTIEAGETLGLVGMGEADALCANPREGRIRGSLLRPRRSCPPAWREAFVQTALLR
jgi:hypothetical protein